MFDVVGLGELLIDFTCDKTDESGYPTLSAHPGGAPGNFLAALSAYGCKTAMIGKVGADTFGRLLTGTLSDLGIDTQGVMVDPDYFTTLAFVTLDATGNREFSFARKPGADTQLTEAEVNALPFVSDTRAFHFGTLSLTCEPARSATRAAIARAKAAGRLISFDPNLRRPLWDSMDHAKEQIEWGLRQSDIVKISDEEIEFMWGLSPEEGAAKLLNEYGVKLVYATLGPKGCYAATKTVSVTVSSPRGIHVVDTTGAGDIFGGSAMSRFLKLDKAIEDLTEDDLLGIVRFGCCAASLSTQSHGGITSVVPIDQVEFCVKASY